MRKLLLFGLTVSAVVVSYALVQAAEPKYTIKEVMAKAHKEGLLKKVTGGTATDAEKKQLCELYEALAANKPPKGGEDAWKTKTDAIVAACKKGDNAALARATNCMACHSAHR